MQPSVKMSQLCKHKSRIPTIRPVATCKGQPINALRFDNNVNGDKKLNSVPHGDDDDYRLWLGLLITLNNVKKSNTMEICLRNS